FRNHFGSWKKALEAAGLKRGRNWGSTPEELLDNLKDVWVKLGRQPKYSEMTIPSSKFSSTAYAHKFGNWTNALKAFQEFLDEDSEPETLGSLSSLKATPHSNGRKTKREPNWRLRFKVMKRDSFRCVACGRSPAKSPDVELHIDHIKPWSMGGETVIENLQTLCSVCNLGKSNVE
ncbi:MAG: HNH endonuclease, partial [Candidatus Omnitrophota bacterium]